MSANATTHSDASSAAAGASSPNVPNRSPDKGKGHARDVKMDEDDDEDSEVEDSDSDEEMEEDPLEEIDPAAILPRTRRTRGNKVDYTSPQALAKAGLTSETPEEEGEDSYHHQEEEEGH